MKNPFAMMAVMAAAMAEAFRENAFRDAGVPLPMNKGRSRIAGKKNPAGAKQIMRFYRAHHGHKAESYAEAVEWYSRYLAEKDAAVRARDAARKSDNAAQSFKLAA